MLIVPLGDDLDHRDFPIAGALVISANVVAFAFTLRQILDASSPLVAHREMVKFVRQWGLVPAVLAQGKPLVC